MLVASVMFCRGIQRETYGFQLPECQMANRILHREADDPVIVAAIDGLKALL
jgi:hypothetical protein